jgi:thiol:disulfide interchange protein
MPFYSSPSFFASYKIALVGLAALIVVFSIVVYMRRRSRMILEENFVEGVRENTMYFFRANWCGHCQRFKPTWDKFVDTCTSSEEHQNTEIVELDVDQPDAKPLLKKYNVTGFPTIIMVNHNTQEKRVFQDERTEEALLKFIKQQ